jgi:hypothetical protein
MRFRKTGFSPLVVALEHDVLGDHLHLCGLFQAFIFTSHTIMEIIKVTMAKKETYRIQQKTILIFQRGYRYTECGVRYIPAHSA